MGTGVRPRSWRGQQVSVGDGGNRGIVERVEDDEVGVFAQAALV